MRKELILVEVYIGKSDTRRDYKLARTEGMAMDASNELFAKWMHKTRGGMVWIAIDGEFDQGWQPEPE